MLTPNRTSPIHMPQTPSVHSPARASPFITVEQKMTMIVMAMEIERLHKILLSKRNYYESKIEEFTTRIHTFKEQTTQQEILIHQLKEQLNQKTIHIGQIIQEKSSEQINNHLNVQLNQLNQQLQSQSQQMNSLQMENQSLKKQYEDAPSLRKRIYELDQTYSKLIFEKNEEIKALKTRIPTLIDQTNQVQLINQLLEQREQELLQWQHSQQQVDLTHDNQRLTNEIKFLNEKLNLVLYENEQLKLKKQEKINIQLTATPPNNDEIKLNSQQVQTPPQLSHRSISPSYLVNTQQRNVINNQRVIHTNILNIPQTQFNVYTPQRLITSTASYQQQQQNASFVDIQLISRNQKSLSPSSQQSAPKYYSPQIRRTSIENAQEFNQLLKKLQSIQNQGHFTQVIIESQIKIIATLLHLKKLELPPQAIPTMSYTAIYQANSVERERSTVRYQQCVSPNRTHLVPPTQAIYINNSQARIKTIPSQHQIVGPSILIKSRSISASSIKERQSQNDLQIILRQVEDSYQKKLQEANQRIQTLIQENQLLQQQSQSQEQKWQLTMQEKYTEALAQLNYFENQIKLQKNSFDTQMQTYQRTSQEQYQLKINQLTQQLQQQQTEITTLKNTIQQLINQSQNGQQSDEIQHLKQLILQIESDYQSKISQLNQNNSQSNNQYLNEQLISELQDKIKELEAQLIYEKQQTHLLKEEFSKQSIHMKDELQRSLQLTSQCERLKVQSDQLSIQNIQSQKTIITLQQQIKQQSSGQVTESQMRKMEQNLNFLQEQLNTQQNQLQQEKQINQQLKSKFDQQVQQIKLQQQTMQQTNLQCKQLSEELQLKQQTIDQQVLIIQQNTEQITVLRQTINTNSQFYKDTQNNGQLLEIQIENLKKQLFDQSQSLQQNQEALRNTQKQYSILLTESKQNKQQFMDLRAKYEEEISKLNQTYQTQITQLQVQITETRTIEEKRSQEQKLPSCYTENIELKSSNQQGQNDQTEQINELKNQLISQRKAFDQEIQQNMNQLNQLKLVNSQLQQQLINSDNDMLSAKAQIESLRNELSGQQLLYKNLQQKYEEEILNIKQAYQSRISEMQVSITETRTIQERQNSSYRHTQESKYMQDLETLKTDNLRLQQYQIDQTEQIQQLKQQLITQLEAFDLEKQQIVHKLVSEIEEKDRQNTTHTYVELTEIQNYKTQLNQYQQVNSTLQIQITNYENDLLQAKAQIESLRNDLQTQQLLYNNLQQKYEEEISKIKQAYQTQITDMQVSITESRTVSQRQSSSYRRSQESKYQQDLQSLQTENLKLQQSIQQGQHDQAQQINELKNQLISQREAFDLERQQIVDKLVREIEEKDKQYESKLKVELVEIQNYKNQLNQLRSENSQLQQQLINSDNDMLSAKAKIQSLSNELQDQQLLYNNMQQKYEEEISNIKQANQTRISEMQVSITETRTIQERQSSSYRQTQESKYQQDLQALKTENLRLQQYQIDQTEQIQQLKQQLITQLEAFDLEKQQIVHKLVSEIEEKDRQNTTHTYVELTEIQNYKTQLNQYQQVNSTLQIQITNYENDLLQAKAQIESLRNDLQTQQLLYNNLQQKYEEEISKIKQAYQTQITDMQVSITESRTVSQRQSSSYRRSQESKYQQDLQSLQTENLKLQQSIQQGQHDQAQQINELKNQLISQREAFDLERQQIVDKLVREIEEKDKQYESKLKVELVEIQNYKNQLNQLRSENSQLQQQLINSDNDMLSAKAKIQSLSNELQDQQLLYNNMQQKYEEEISNIKQANQTRISEMQVSITETRTIQERQSSSYHRSYESKYQQNLQSLQTENLNLQQSIQQGQNDQAGQINELKNQLMSQSDAFDLERQQIVDKLVREIEEKDKELLQIQQQYQQLQFDNQELIISQNNELELLRQELHDQREGSDNQLHQQIAKLVAEIEAQDAEILQLKQQLKQLPQLESQLYTQNEKLSNQQKQNDQQKSILLQLQQQIKTQEDQIRGLLLQQQDMNKENENERKRLQEENLRLTQSMMDLQKQAQNNSKDIENYQLQQQLYIFQVQINELQKSNQEVQIKYEKTLELYNKLQGQFKLTQDKLFQMESDYQLLEQQDEYEKQHLTTQLQQLQGQLDQSRTIEQLLNKQLSEAELKINKLAHENKSLKKSSVEIHEEGSDIDRNSLYRNLGEQLKTTQQQLSQSEYEADELKRSLNNQIDQLSQKLNLANSQISNLNQQQNLNLQDKQGQINQLKNELNIANARLQELLNLEQEYQLKISRLSDLDQQIYQERESKQQLIQQQQNEIRKYKVEIDNLSNQLTNQSSNSLEEIHKLKIQIRQQESQLRQLNYDKQDLQIQLDTEKKIYQDKLENLNELLSQTNNDSLNFDKSLIQKQNQELLELQRKFDNLQENNLKNQYSSENNIKLQSQILQQAAEIDKLQNYANSLESDKQNQLQQINKLKYQIENLESRQSETKSQYLSLNETLQTYQAQNVKYEQILIQKDHEINKMKFQIQDLIAQSNQDETLIRELKAKIQLLEGQIILIEENQQNMQQTYINQYSLKIDEMNLDLVNKIERLKQQLAEEQDQHLNETQDLQHQLNKYTIQIRTLEDKIRSLEYELETSKSDQNNVVIEKIIDNDYDIENQQLRQQLGILKQKYDDLFFNQSYQAERDVQLRRLDDQIQILYQQIQQQSNDHKQKLAQIDKEHSFQILQYQEKIKDLEDKYGLQLGNDKSLLLENQELANQIKYLSEDLTLQRTLLQQLKDKPKEIIVNRFENSPRGQSELMALTRQNQEQEIIIQQLNSKISQIEQENKSLIQANQEQQLAANKFQQDFDNLQRQIRDYKNEIEVLKQQNQRLVNNQQQQQYQYQQQQQQQDQQLQSLQQQQQQNQQQFQQNTINEDEFNLQKQQIKLLKQQVNDKNNEIDQLVNQLQQTRQSQRKEQLLVSPQTLHQSQSSQDLQQSRNYEDLALYFPNGMKKIVFQTPQNKLKSSKIESQTDLHILQQNEKELRKQVEIWKRKYEKLLQTQYSYSHTPDKKTTQQHESTAQQNEELRIWQKKYNELLNQQSSINTDKDLYQLKSLNQKLLSDLQQTQVESQQKIKQLQHDLDESFQVQCSLNDIEFKNRQYQTELARMQQQLDQVSNLNKQIMDDNYKLKSNLQNNTQNQKRNESEYSSDLINELNLYKSQNENLRKQVAQLKEMQSKQQQEITTLTYSVEERTNKFGNNQQIISENDYLRKQVQELRDQLNKQQQEARFQQGTLIEESQRYKSQLENTRKQMNDSNSLISSLQFELNTLKNRNESNMQNQNDIYIKQIESLRVQLDSQSIYRKENDQLKNQLLEQKDLKQQLQDEINYLRKEKEQNQSKVQTDQLRNQLIEQNEHISKLQSELILLKSQLESSQFNDINRQKPQLDNLRQQLSDSVQEQQRMESELVTMRTQYDTIKFSMNSKEMELNQLKTKLRVLKSQTQYQDKAQFYEDKIQQLQQEINKLQNSEKELLNQLQFWKEKVYTLKTTINKIEKEVINLNEIINQLLQGEPQQSKQIKNQQTRTDYTYMDNKQTEQNRQSWI